METDSYWTQVPHDSPDGEIDETIWEWKLTNYQACDPKRSIPAVQFAEVWRELPDDWFDMEMLLKRYANNLHQDFYVAFIIITLKDVNSLIELLIWTKERKT